MRGIIAGVLVATIAGVLARYQQSLSSQSTAASLPIVKQAALCRNGNQSSQSCWAKLFSSVISRNGIDAALDLLAYAFEEADDMGSGTCHDLAHTIGRETYKLFRRGKMPTVSPKASLCSYGFFHGVIEGMIALKRPLTDARRFCFTMKRNLAESAPEVSMQCFHGIGHGTVNVHDKRLWGNELAMMTPALAICDVIGTNREERWRCASGTFHVLRTFYLGSLYNITVNRQDPFWVCKALEREEYQETCFREVANVLGMVVPDGDFLAIAERINSIENDQFATETMITWGVPYQENIAYRPVGIAFCRKVPARLAVPCVKSIARQMIQAGEPGDELRDALQFCQSPGFSRQEREGCFDFVLYWNGRWLVREKAQENCRSVMREYQSVCYTMIEKTRSIN